MASVSFRSTVATLSLCQGCARVTRDFYAARPRNKTVMGLVDKLEESTSRALDRWPGGLTPKEVAQIDHVMRRAELACFPGDSPMEDAISYTSLSLGLLDELEQCVKDPERKRLVADVERKMRGLHMYLDRRLDKWRNYERASYAVQVWKKEMES